MGSGSYDVTCNCSYSFCWNVRFSWEQRLSIFFFFFFLISFPLLAYELSETWCVVYWRSSPASGLWDSGKMDIEKQCRVWEYELVGYKRNAIFFVFFSFTGDFLKYIIICISRVVWLSYISDVHSQYIVHGAFFIYGSLLLSFVSLNGFTYLWYLLLFYKSTLHDSGIASLGLLLLLWSQSSWRGFQVNLLDLETMPY